MINRFTKLFYDKFFKKTFLFWQKIGLDILPNHYYSPVPDLRELKDNTWSSHTELVGLNFNEKKQLELLLEFKNKFKDEFDRIPLNESKIFRPYEYFINNEYFGPVSGEILYSMIRYFKPKKIIEVGSGFSTFLMAQTVLKNKEQNHDYNCELISIDPYPNNVLKVGFPGLSKLISKKVQEVPIREFVKLKENDIFFIDSSHVLKIGGDVRYLYLEILPRLNKGVIIHIHDILLPAEYHKSWILKEKMFWNEQYLLQAFLAFNNSFEVLWAGSFMHFKHPDKLKLVFNNYNKKTRFSTSFWMKKIK